MVYEQQESLGNKVLKMKTVPKDSKAYNEKKQQYNPEIMEKFMSSRDAAMLRELLFCCKDNASELGEEQFDYIIVLGSNSIEANCKQLISAVTSGHLKKGGIVILSGRYPDAKEGSGLETEAVRMSRYLEGCWDRTNGMLTSDQLILEEESTNAKENVINSFKIIQEQQSAELDRPCKVLFIAKAFMTYRVKMYLSYWVRGMSVEVDYLGVTEPKGTKILHIGKNDFDTQPDSTARVYEEAIRLINFSQYRTDGNLSDLELPEETAKQLLKMLNHVVIYPEFFKIQREGKSEAVMCSLYLSTDSCLEGLLK